ncbi:cohesin domain-containing protein [Pseudoduganella plicata]|uniref:General secretion pathway protein GspD n=1 Tax=Pseudoduganella plicata TaxID=321984 RepID=A0A4P7BDV1_9BURK|nr:cohesin domain-containing protein [Pseudoduganella plicata]QBQ36866.1 general secretion pathway protein GspD [Pseudoduganella plicata]GGY72053.1 type II secretion system protein [Pseudoduganella plicata]
MTLKTMKRLGTIAVLAALAGCAAQSHHRSGIAALEQQDYPLAVSELAQASQLKPESIEYRRDWLRARENATNRLLQTATAALARGERNDVQQAYQTVLKYDPDNARARAGLDNVASMARADEEASNARAAMKSGDVARAAELLTSALKRVPAHPEALTLRAELDAAQTQQSVTAPSLGAAYRKPINLEFRDASVKIVFDALARTTGINFIFDRDVKPDQRTTVFLKQTSLDDAIDVILSTSQLEKKVLNASSVLIYPNTPAKLKEYQDLVVRAFYTANIEAKQAATMLKTVLKLKDIYVDDKYNMLVLRETPETISLAEKLIRLQDLEEPEVMLEVEVLEINRTRLLNAGVQWNSQLTVTPLGATSSVPVNGTSTSAMKLSDLRNLNSTQIGITVPSATINLQKTVGDANLLANPRIRVRDREKAKIMIGDKVPVVTTTSTNTFVTENIQYLDVGLKLEVEPDIHVRDEIGLKIGLEVSSLVSSVKTNNGSQAYQIGTRNVNTALRLKDGETQVLAGLISDEDRASGNRIPLLGDFPILGRLFGSQSDSTQKTEVVLSITPRLIRNIARRDPAQEAFWSGTESTLRDRPLQLRTMDAKGASGAPGAGAVPAAAAGTDAVVTPAAGPDAPKFAWTGPASVKAGETVTLKLNMDSPKALRAASLQLGFNPAEFDIVSIDDGGYFNQGGKGAFSKSVDAASGRASVGFNNEGGEAKGEGAVLAVTLRARVAAPEAQVSLIAATPIGASTAISRPALPAWHRIAITP